MRGVYFVLFAPLFLYSQNLKELIDLSINNKIVNSSKETLEAIKDEYRATKSSYMPSFDIGAKISTTDKETQNTAKLSANSYLSMSYTLYDGGKKENIYDSYEYLIKSKEESIEALKNSIALNVVNLYFNYLSLNSQKDAKLKEIEQLDSQMQRLDRFLKAGTTTEDEVQKIISRVESANVSLQEIDLQIVTILHQLEYITGLRVDITTGSSIKELQSKDDEILRFDIKAIEYDLQRGLSDSKAQKSSELPTVTFENSYTYYESKFDNKSYEKNALNHQNITLLNLKWNLYSFDELKYRYQAKFKEYLSLKSKYEYEKNRASVDLKLALKSYEIAKAKIKSAKANLKASQSAYDVIKSKYENGLIDNVAYLESLSEKFDAISQLDKSLNDLEIKKAEIIYQSGNRLLEYIR